nr:hypothetical protein BaRGS_029094 [Batillaria attramentaria]
MVQMANFIVPDLGFEGHYHNLNSVLWSVINISRGINSSTNFFVYYTMGSRFRETLRATLSCRATARVHAEEMTSQPAA